jgi:hypothetical protein
MYGTSISKRKRTPAATRCVVRSVQKLSFASASRRASSSLQLSMKNWTCRQTRVRGKRCTQAEVSKSAAMVPTGTGKNQTNDCQKT